ncbi:hypothetical protein CYY_004858 [Polysphondylium violaceum]|uniref:Peptidase C39-like domain-containing protein n=1 Tax=Polysphondylium violaceum TaxID=133409 RepID=A0A8J4USN7_9MYCE|nr:hypothetical protein CYY_004858 [Polysphondylium violaceum]
MIKSSLLLLVTIVVIAINAIPTAYQIQGIPYHRQVTEYNCGDASMEMVFGHLNREIDQYQLDDIARTSDTDGTSSYDIVRSFQFSVMSSSMGLDEKDHEVKYGFKKYPLGLLSIGFASSDFWIDELKSMIALDIPVITLMAYLPSDRGGHFRVIYGYDDESQTIYSLDPWDRQGQPRLYNMSYSLFENLWNYTEPQSPRGLPFFGAMAWSLPVQGQASTNGNQSSISYSFNYVNPFPFDNVNTSLPTPLQALTTITPLSKDILIMKPSSGISTPGSQVIQNKELNFLFEVECVAPTGCKGLEVQITTSILVTGSLPYTNYKQTTFYLGYNYNDMLGETIVITL